MTKAVRIRSFVALVATSALLMGCAGRTPAEFKTPEECFQFARKSAEKKDYVAAVDCMTEDSQEVMAGMMVTAGAMTKAFAGFATAFSGGGEEAEQIKESLAKIDEVLNKHGINDDTLANMEGGGFLANATGTGPGRDPEEALDGIRQMAKPISDHRTFVAEMITALESVGDKSEENDSPIQGFVGELKDVKIEGDKATATIVKSNGEVAPIGFRKTHRGWRIQLDAKMLQQQNISDTQTF